MNKDIHLLKVPKEPKLMRDTSNSDDEKPDFKGGIHLALQNNSVMSQHDLLKSHTGHNTPSRSQSRISFGLIQIAATGNQKIAVRGNSRSPSQKMSSDSARSISQTQSARGSNRKKPTRSTRKVKQNPTHLDRVFKAINERPQLDGLTREERIREKLKFFKIENESLEVKKKRVAETLKKMATRFGPAVSSQDGSNPDLIKLHRQFNEMMAIEAEFGSIYEDPSKGEKPQKKESKWLDIFQTITDESKQTKYQELLTKAQQHKEEIIMQRHKDMIKQKIARGTHKNEQKDKQTKHIDISALIAEERKLKKKKQMDKLLLDIKNLNEKFINDEASMEFIKKTSNYKYPQSPTANEEGDDMYNEVLSRIKSRWNDGELDDMRHKSENKIKSQSQSRSGNYASKFGKIVNRFGSINVQDFRETDKSLSRDDSNMRQSRSPQPLTQNTMDQRILDLKTYLGQDKGVLSNLIKKKSGQPNIWTRNFSTIRKSPKSGSNMNDYTQMLSKQPTTEKKTTQSKLNPTSLTTQRPSPAIGLLEGDSFYVSTLDSGSPQTQMVNKPPVKLKTTPISDAQWKEHLCTKNLRKFKDLDAYATKLEVEMRIYCQNRLENIHDNFQIILDRFKQIKLQKKHGKITFPFSLKEESISATRTPTSIMKIYEEHFNSPEDAQFKTVFSSEELGRNGGQTAQQSLEKQTNVQNKINPTLSYSVSQPPAVQATIIPVSDLANPHRVRAKKKRVKSITKRLPILQSHSLDQVQSPQIIRTEPHDPSSSQQKVLVMRTVNDKQFDVTLITRFDKKDYRKTKIILEQVKLVLLNLSKNDLGSFDFNWSIYFKNSIFQEDVENEIVPILRILKKIAHNGIGNMSLRTVLARKLVNKKVKSGIIDPKEFPSLEKFSDNLDIAEINQIQRANEDFSSKVIQPIKDLLQREVPTLQESVVHNQISVKRRSTQAKSIVSFKVMTHPERRPEHKSHGETKKWLQNASNTGRRQFYAPPNDAKINTPQHLYGENQVVQGGYSWQHNNRRTTNKVIDNHIRTINSSDREQQTTLVPSSAECPLYENSLDNSKNTRPPDRMIKSSHMAKRRNMILSEEINERSFQEARSPTPTTLPYAENRSFLKSAGRQGTTKIEFQKSFSRGRYKSNVFTTLQNNSQTYVSPAKINEMQKKIVPGSVYNLSLAPVQDFQATQKSAQSVNIQGKTFRKVRISVKRNKNRVKILSKERLLKNCEVEQNVAERIFLKSGHRTPSTTRGKHSMIFHKTMVNSIGPRHIQITSLKSVLPENCTHKALRAFVYSQQQSSSKSREPVRDLYSIDHPQFKPYW